MAEPADDYRNLAPHERAVIERLLQGKFEGRDDLLRQLSHAKARTIDGDGGLEISEAGGIDIDGACLHVLLHVIDGRLRELELYRDDGLQVKQFPQPESISPESVSYESSRWLKDDRD